MKKFAGFVLAIAFIAFVQHPVEAKRISNGASVDVDTTIIHKKLLKKWQLIELNGQSVESMGKPAKTPYIQFDSTRKVSGNNGCNQFFGSYELEKHGRIKFSAMGSTRMACLDNNTMEADVMDMIARTDSYVLVNDTLVFNKARMAPLARWVKMKPQKTKKKKK